MAINWTNAIIQGAGLWDQLDRYDDLGNYVERELGGLADEAISGTSFRPFTVSSPIGSMTGGPEGVTTALAPEQYQQMEQLRQFSSDFFGSAAGPQADRERSSYEAIRALQMPGEERAQLATEARAQAQGRLGLGGANYAGSTPEMLALQERIGQNERAAAVQSIADARMQQRQDADIGSMFQANQFLPIAQNQNLFNQGMQVANMNQAGQIAGQNLASQLGLGQVQAQVNSEQIRAQLMANLFRTIGGAAQQSGFDPVGDIYGGFRDWLSGIFT